MSRQNILTGCGFLVLLSLIGLLTVAILALNRDVQAARYPGAAPLSRRSFYTPRYTFWNNVYLTSDPAGDIHDWYINRLNMTLVSDQWVGEDCFLLNRLRKRLTVEHELGILVCQTPAGQEIYVTRSIALR